MSHSSRRTFLKTAGALSAAACIGNKFSVADVRHVPVGLQLYSVREQLPKDFDGTLHQLSGIGIKEVEAAGYFKKTAAEFRHSLDQAGLRCVSTHHALLELRPKLDEWIDYGHTIGLEYIICSWAGVHRDPARKGEMTLDDWRYAAEEFNKIGEKTKAAGITFGYHNHWVEFGTEGGVVFYDELLKGTDPKLVFFEMDCGWVVAGGHNPVDYLSKTPERFPMLHVKDLVKQENGKYKNVVMGKGTIDYKPIMAAATGLKHYFIEQEEFVGDPITELHEDVEYMHKIMG
jgi:sugar phosphate isomerase/epimerase